ncbi:MAG: ATP-binding protein [Peptococcaceae bacterium]|nr:ATP-binding protein [Peptococcaceae bacterium]
MYRTAIEKLYKWNAKTTRKPLIIRGARQVGKTWLMKEFGAAAFPHCVYISFDNNKQMHELFSADLNVSRLITGLELYAGHKIDPAKTLIIFDEIQEIPQALTSLKYFNENAPQYQILCAGSLLGVALHPGTSFPVGKVEFLDLYPLSFPEFMRAMAKESFVTLLEQGDYAMAATFKHDYTDLLKHYFYVGGMPEAVASFAANRDFNEVREIQQRILDTYEQDFSKHAPHDTVPRIRLLWNSIPSQLTKENRKFLYGLIKEGSRAREYEYALMWLTDCGLVHKIHRVTAPNLPLKAYEDLKSFKLFFVDIGLLSCLTQLKQNVLLDGNRLFKEFKGALTEQYVLQQLIAFCNLKPYYWTNSANTSEIDFLLDIGNNVIPLEVKAEVNLQSKSLKTFADKYNPILSVRSSMSDYKHQGWLLNLPLYAIGNIKSFSTDT